MAMLDIKGCLQHQPLFSALSDAQLAALVAATHEVRADKGKLLFQRGTPCEGMYLVVFGVVKLAVSGVQGVEKIVELVRVGESFGEAVMFLNRPFPIMAQTLEDSLLLYVEAAAIDNLLAQDPKFARRLLAGLSVRLHALVRDVESYSTQNAAQRVIGYLLQSVSTEHGESEGDIATHATTVSLPVNKNLIASRLNLTPETLSRVLHHFVADGLIEVNGREIVIHDTRRLAAHLQPE
jgi:CRP-like cAMP-binding protein